MTRLLEQSYSIEEYAQRVVEDAWSEEQARDMKILGAYYEASEKCGCGQCNAALVNFWLEMQKKWSVPE